MNHTITETQLGVGRMAIWLVNVDFRGARETELRVPIMSIAEVLLEFKLKAGLVHNHQITLADFDFPGDVLSGIDFLKRDNFTLQLADYASTSTFILEGCPFSNVYTDTKSVKLTLVNKGRIGASTQTELVSEPASKSNRDATVYLAKQAVIPSHSGIWKDMSLD